MKLLPDDLTRLADVALAAARRTGRYISETRPTVVRQDKDGDCLAAQVLTEVDGQSQEMILEILRPTFAEFDLALLAEESEDDGSRLEKDYFWCIDPIDGTLSFIENAPGYSVSIALIARDGIPQIGVVYDPVEHNLYHAIRGQGAFRNSEPWRLAQNGDRLRIFTDRSAAAEPWFAPTNEVLQAEVAAHGGGVMNAIWTLENPPACYFKYPKERPGCGCFWDFAATACIAHELGAVATDIQGHRLDLNRRDSIYLNHGGILYATDGELAARVRGLYEEYRA
ncbi:3'(2'),5'-bisphosphate nucleotidase CysQ [Pontiella sp.]|uniref:3'(2'),5'-bisphosphate nucleotidase CysQ family protein n=1 Tax=Pontiella sp. TaxID=2837462 RepID=UPI00356873A9